MAEEVGYVRCIDEEVGYVRCIDGFMLHDRTIVKGGQILAANDRAIKGREHLFVPIESDEQGRGPSTSVAGGTVPVAERVIQSGPRVDKIIATAEPVKKVAG